MGIGFWSLVAISYQTFLCILLSWLTLSCRLTPNSSELDEVTLFKLLYLYDPEACQRMHFYNFTKKIELSSHNLITARVVWPITNRVSARFRSKIKVWLVLHLLWMILGVANMTQGNRPCAFYVTLIPFTVTGAVLLVIDLVFAGLFLADAKSTGTETAILNYINDEQGSVGSVNITRNNAVVIEEDTSWIAVLLAYASIRGVVQWIFNFWIIKDNYFEGLENYQRLQYQSHRSKLSSKNSQYTDTQV